MSFWLKTFNIYYIALVFDNNVKDYEPGRFAPKENFNKDDYSCQGWFLSALNDKLYDLYCETTTAKECGIPFKETQKRHCKR